MLRTSLPLATPQGGREARYWCGFKCTSIVKLIVDYALILVCIVWLLHTPYTNVNTQEPVPPASP